MADKIKLDYRLAEEMIQSFRNGQEKLEETQRVAQDILRLIDDGALVGIGGTAYREAVEGKLGQALKTMIDKFVEMQGDVQAAVKAMEDADKASADSFRS